MVTQRKVMWASQFLQEIHHVWGLLMSVQASETLKLSQVYCNFLVKLPDEM